MSQQEQESSITRNKAEIVANYIKELRDIQADHKYEKYKDILFIFQSHNKGHLIKKIITPFTSLGAANIILYADACCDETLSEAKELLPGSNHFIISSNNTFEIKNYRLACKIGTSLRCKYAVLLQDDDYYIQPDEWLRQSLDKFDNDKNLSIIGLNAARLIHSLPGNLKAIFPQKKIIRQPWANYLDASFQQHADRVMSHVYVGFVNRAPQVIKIEDAINYGYFPEELEPWGIDDEFMCLKAWSVGKKVLYMPLKFDTVVRNYGIGGMRAYTGKLDKSNFRQHLERNGKWVFKQFENEIHDGTLAKKINTANRILR